MAPKRTIDEVVSSEQPSASGSGSSTPKSATTTNYQKNKRQRQRKNKRDTIAAKLGEEAEEGEEVEEGEVVEGDFSDLFMVDTTPAQVAKENRYDAQPASPTAKKEENEEDEQQLVEEDETTFDEQDLMKVFAKEVAMTDDEEEEGDSEDSSSEGEDESGINIEGMMLFDDEEGLKEAIQGKIVDDSSAPVSSRMLSYVPHSILLIESYRAC